MKIPETYEEFLKTPDDVLIEISKSDMSLNDARRLISFIIKVEDEFAEKDKLISEEKRKKAKSNWERYCK